MKASRWTVAALGLLTLSISCTGRCVPQSTDGTTNHSPIPAEDRLEIESKRLAGPNAIDCGRVRINDDPKSATQCAVAAQSAQKPFRVRYDLRGFDSAVAVALVRTPVGTVGTLSYDSDPSGGSHIGEVVFPKPCPLPVHFSITRSGRINCFPPDPSKHPDAMSPVAEPY